MSPKSKTVAGLLAIFLGSFGAHRFYLGQPWKGLLYLLFFWTYIPTIAGLIEGFRYLFMSETDFQSSYAGEEGAKPDSSGSSGIHRSSGGGSRRKSKPVGEFKIDVSRGYPGKDLSPEEKHKQSAKAWVPPGERRTVKGYDLLGGMVYVGKKLAGGDSYGGKAPCLINTSLKVDRRRLDPDGNRMSYWPSYSDIDAGCRATFLEWLSTGRRDPSFDVGYVFLFFYGLERRVLFDAEFSQQARNEVPRILDEVEELLEVYGENNSFNGYAQNFLNIARAKYQPDNLGEGDATATTRRGSLPLSLKIRVGRRIANREPIEGPLALEWFEQATSTRLRTPGKRCNNEFRKLFLARYQERYGDGLVLEYNQPPLTLRYRTASRTLESPGEIRVGNLPDIAALETPVREFEEIADECQSELDSYSRHVGKTGDRESLEALALLPPSLLANHDTDALSRFVDSIETELESEDIARTKADTLLQHWPISPHENVRSKHLRGLAELLESLGYGIEPDIRFGAPTRGWGEDIVLFRMPEGESEKDPDVLDGVRLLQKLAMSISLADGEVTEDEIDHLSTHLNTALDLDGRDRARLRAHREWLALDSPTLHGVRSRAEDLPPERRERVAKFLTTLACADGDVDPGEVEILKKVYPMLGLDAGVVHTHIHQLQLDRPRSDDEPVTIRNAQPGSPSYAIPDPDGGESSPEVTGVTLDMEKVESTLDETEEVSRFLGDIFEDEDAQMNTTSEPAVEAAPPSSPIEGLDDPHADLLRKLASRPQWGRQEFEEIASELNLFPDAALDVINDYAFERVDAPVIEGFDELDVDQELCREVMQ